MYVLEDYQLPSISGGDHWGYEDASGSAEENSASSQSYQNSSGTWGNPGLAVNATQSIAIALNKTGESLSGCYTIQIGPVSEQTCYGTDGSKAVQTCINLGPSASIGGFGVGVTLSGCTTRNVP